jgi:hypothetical protein
MRRQEKAEEDDAMGELGKAPPAPQEQGYPVIPPLDQEQEYEWKWKVCLPLSCDSGMVLISIAKDGGFQAYLLLVVCRFSPNYFLCTHTPLCTLLFFIPHVRYAFLSDYKSRSESSHDSADKAPPPHLDVK